jgi:hypothetical protein
MWLQWSRVAWLKEGDRNTKKNHMKAAGRAKKNRVAHLRKDDGHITQHKKEMKHMAQSFFLNLYHAIRVYTQMSCCIYSNHELHNI